MLLFRNHYPINIYLKFRPTIVLFALSILILLVNWIWLLSTIGIHGDTAFLHYSILYGVDLTGPTYRLYTLPFVGLVFFLINGILGWLLFSRERFYSIVLNTISVFCQVFLLVGTALLIFLNT